MNKIVIHRTTKTDTEIVGYDSRLEDMKGFTVMKFVTIEPLNCLPCGRYFFYKCLASDKHPYEHLIIQGQKQIVGRVDAYLNENICVGKSTSASDEHPFKIDASEETLSEILSLLPEEGMIDIIEEY